MPLAYPLFREKLPRFKENNDYYQAINLAALISLIIDAAIQVQRRIGIGQSKATFHAALEQEMFSKGIPFRSNIMLPINYKFMTIKNTEYIDIIVNSHVGILVTDSLATNHDWQSRLNYLLNQGNLMAMIGLNTNLVLFRKNIEVVVKKNHND